MDNPLKTSWLDRVLKNNINGHISVDSVEDAQEAKIELDNLKKAFITLYNLDSQWHGQLIKNL